MSERLSKRIWIRWIAVWGLVGWMSAGCIAGVHHHRLDATVDGGDYRADVDGSINSVDLGIVADFRYLRVGLPFEGQRYDLNIDVDGGGQFSVDRVFELRSLRLDVPIWSLRDFSDEPSGQRYPGNMRRRHSLELWASGSVGMTPIHPATGTVSLAYYRYGAMAGRLYGGVSFSPFEGLERGVPGGGDIERRAGYAPGLIIGVEMTLAAGEYALELVQFIIDMDRDIREGTDRWN